MTNYYDTVDFYETPQLNQNERYVNPTMPDHTRQMQVRMGLILGMAMMIASVLALFALPVNVGKGSGAVDQVSSDNLPIVEEQQVLTSNSPALVTSGSGIAPFFTPEVRYWETDILRWAKQYEVDPNAVATIMQIESCGDPQAESIAGAKGLFQVMPFHFSADEIMLDPDTNARRGLDFLNEQLRYTSGDIFLSFAGYNGGYAASGGNYNNWPDETKRYFRWAKGIYEDASSGAAHSTTLDEWLDAGGRPGCQRAAGRLGI